MFQERARFGRRPTTRQGSTTGGREQPIRRCRTERQEQGAGRRVERQFAMSSERVNEIGEAGNQPFTANAVGDFPEPDEGLLDGGGVGLRAGASDRTGAGKRRMVQEGQGIFAVIAGGRDELIEDAHFVGLRRENVAR